MTVSAQQLQKIMPAATPARIANFVGPLNSTMDEFGITTPKRQAAFLASALAAGYVAAKKMFL